MTRRVLLQSLAALVIAFAAYGSFVPFHFRAVGLAQALQQFAATPLIPLHKASKSDFITNVLLFVPIGFFLLGALANSSRKPALLLALPVAIAGVAISIAIEFGQVFVHDRTPSWNDVVAETLGGGIGALVWLAAGHAIVEWCIRPFRPAPATSVPRTASVRIRPAAVLIPWLCLLGVRHWSPYDVVTDLAFMKARIPDMMAVPFSSHYRGFAPYVLVDTTSKLLMAIPVGALLQLIWHPRTLVSRWIVGTGIVALSGAMFLALELGQQLLPSRVPDQTDVYIGTLGALMGVVFVWSSSGTARLKAAGVTACAR